MEHSGRVRRSKTTTKSGKGRGKGASKATKKGSALAARCARAPQAGPPRRTQRRYRPRRSRRRMATSTSGRGWCSRASRSSRWPATCSQAGQPGCTSQNAAEEAVLARALALLRRMGLAAIVLRDRGVGRKDLLIRLANEEQACVLRVDRTSRSILPTPPLPMACSWPTRSSSSRGGARWSGTAGSRAACVVACAPYAPLSASAAQGARAMSSRPPSPSSRPPRWTGRAIRWS